MSSNPIASAIFITQSPRNGALSFLADAHTRPFNVRRVFPITVIASFHSCTWPAVPENMRPVNVLLKKTDPGMVAAVRGRHAARPDQI
jgi:hypothetical protein